MLVTQVPISRSWQAAWLIESAPATTASLQLGAMKALVVRFVVPLYLLFALLTFSLTGAEAILRLTLPAFCVAALAVAHLWPLCVAAPPLSMSPEDFTPPTAWYASLVGWAMGLTILAIFVERKVEAPWARSRSSRSCWRSSGSRNGVSARPTRSRPHERPIRQGTGRQEPDSQGGCRVSVTAPMRSQRGSLFEDRARDRPCPRSTVQV